MQITWLLAVDPADKTAHTSEHCVMISPALRMSPTHGTSQDKSSTLLANEWPTTVSLIQYFTLIENFKKLNIIIFNNIFLTPFYALIL